MSQADELLNSLSGEGSGEIALESTVEEHIVIDSKRFITVPESLRRIAVQYDHNVETVTFDCPRYWDGLDLSELEVRINYTLSNGKRGSYEVLEVTVDDTDESIMHFDWIIDNTVSSIHGGISFLVCMKTTDENGVEINHWNSELNRQMYVSEGMPSVQNMEEQYPDVVTQIVAQLDMVDDALETVQNAKQVCEEAKNAVGSISNALKGSAIGEVARLDDVSPLAHELAVKVKSKNLFNREATIYENGTLVFEGNTQIYTSTGTGGNLKTTLGNYKDFVGKTITVSYELVEVKSTAGRTIFNTYIQTDTGTVIAQRSNLEADGKTFKLTAKIPEDGTATSLVIRQYVGYMTTEAGDYVKIANMQAEYGKEKTAYTPYIEDVNAVTRYGKNLLNHNVDKMTKISFMGKTEMITRNGYALPLSAGTYTISAEPKGSEEVTAIGVYAVLDAKDGSFKQTAHAYINKQYTPTTFEADEGDVLYVYDGRINNSLAQSLEQSKVELSSLTIQVEEGATATAHVPYTEPVVSAVKVRAQGKNFFNNDVSNIKEITYIGSSGNPAQRNGYATRLPHGTYMCHARYIGGSIPEANTYIYGVLNTKDGAYKQTVMLKQATTRQDVVINVEEGDILYIYDGVKQLLKQSQKVFEGVEVQVEAGETVTVYEPYVEPVEYAQNDKIAPIYPTTTLTTDTTGTIIECQYNRDLNKAFAELVEAIISLGGNV